ncbi:MAG TPA: TerC family protein [Vicinamibacteria bacterium]|nr:TerC family protein [Vicinamibacteria bacterium]
MDVLLNPASWVALLTLTVMEIVLGIDNVIFISILAAKLPGGQADRARKVGLLLAMVARIALLFSISWLARLTAPLFSLLGQEISGRDLMLIAGGLFLLAKSTYEIHDKLEGGHERALKKVVPSMAGVLIQITLLDLVFSLDSVITAIGMVDRLAVMVIAIVVAVGFMLVFAGAISRFVNDHPTIKILALSFLILIGVLLVAEGFEQHIPKGYVYFAMAFSVGVEMLNLRLRKTSEPVQLGGRYAQR